MRGVIILGTSNLNTISVSGIPVSFDLGQANYTPISGWDAYSWGQGNWGEIPNSDITLTGLSATFNLRTSRTIIKFRLGKINLGFFYLGTGYGTCFTFRSFCNILILVM
jgi:hypothetical protein